MAPRVKKIRRHRDDGELVIEQTRDLARVATLFEAAGLPATGLERPGCCYLSACIGTRPVGVAGVETRIDIAVLGALVVLEELRRRGIGTALLAAARAAAHTRGARGLYALAPPEIGEFFASHGFAAVAVSEATAALAGTFVTNPLPTSSANTGCTAWLLDISRDGIVMR
jgi:GNAT superfamily N-acetyltransferase